MRCPETVEDAEHEMAQNGTNGFDPQRNQWMAVRVYTRLGSFPTNPSVSNAANEPLEEAFRKPSLRTSKNGAARSSGNCLASKQQKAAECQDSQAPLARLVRLKLMDPQRGKNFPRKPKKWTSAGHHQGNPTIWDKDLA